MSACATLAIGYLVGHRPPAGNTAAAARFVPPARSANTPPPGDANRRDQSAAPTEPRTRFSENSLFGPPPEDPAPRPSTPPAPKPVFTPPNPEDPLQHFTYTGSATNGDQTFAMLMDDRATTETMYSVGDTVEGYTITSIEPEAVTVRVGKQDRRLTVVDRFNPVPMVATAPKDVRPNPGNLAEYRDKTYQSFYFQVTGTSSGTVWGSGSIYTDDSQLATAAVHAGVLKDGEAGVVRVTVLPGYDHYDGATSNGVTSQSYAQWQGSYRVDRL